MPLETRNFRYLDEEPLPSGILEARLDNTQFHSAARVNNNLVELRRTPGPELTIHTLAKVNDTWPDGEAPALVSQTVLCRVEGERVGIIWVGGISDEATSCVCVETDHPEEGEVMGVPESLEALVSDLPVSRGIDEDHDKQHEMTGYASSLRVVNIQRGLLADLCRKHEPNQIKDREERNAHE